jgi:hypothetical protein
MLLNGLSSLLTCIELIIHDVELTVGGVLDNKLNKNTLKNALDSDVAQISNTLIWYDQY